MKQISAIILTFFLATLKLYSQNIFESNWYNSNGKLQADTNYIINKEQYSKWIPIEHHFTKAFGQQFTFPSYLRGTSTYGNLVFSFETDTNGILYKSTIESINVKLDTNIKANLNLVCDSIVKSRLPFVLATNG